MKVASNRKLFTLKTLRKQLGMSQTALAKALGVRQATISDWERGMCRPTLTIEQIQILEALLKRVGLTFNDLPTDISN
jgi:transcriptional regulator with XRE-family HTH domain